MIWFLFIAFSQISLHLAEELTEELVSIAANALVGRVQCQRFFTQFRGAGGIAGGIATQR